MTFKISDPVQDAHHVGCSISVGHPVVQGVEQIWITIWGVKEDES